MKTLITILLCFIFFGGFSQTNTIKIRKEEDRVSKPDTTDIFYENISGAISFGYSQKFYKFNFQNEMKSLGKIEFNSLPVNSISVNSIGMMRINRRYSFPSVTGYQYIIPTQITINDTSIQTLNGYNINFSVAGQKIITKRNFSLFLTEGFRFGRIKLKDKNRVRIKNPINAIFVASVMRVSFYHFSIFATAQYDLDFSPKRWRKMWFYKAQELEIPNFDQSGLELRFGINFSLYKDYQQVDLR